MNKELMEKVVRTRSDKVAAYQVCFGTSGARVFVDEDEAKEFKRLCLKAGIDPAYVSLEKKEFDLIEA